MENTCRHHIVRAAFYVVLARDSLSGHEVQNGEYRRRSQRKS